MAALNSPEGTLATFLICIFRIFPVNVARHSHKHNKKEGIEEALSTRLWNMKGEYTAELSLGQTDSQVAAS